MKGDLQLNGLHQIASRLGAFWIRLTVSTVQWVHEQTRYLAGAAGAIDWFYVSSILKKKEPVAQVFLLINMDSLSALCVSNRKGREL